MFEVKVNRGKNQACAEHRSYNACVYVAFTSEFECEVEENEDENLDQHSSQGSAKRMPIKHFLAAFILFVINWVIFIPTQRNLFFFVSFIVVMDMEQYPNNCRRYELRVYPFEAKADT